MPLRARWNDGRRAGGRIIRAGVISSASRGQRHDRSRDVHSSFKATLERWGALRTWQLWRGLRSFLRQPPLGRFPPTADLRSISQEFDEANFRLKSATYERSDGTRPQAPRTPRLTHRLSTFRSFHCSLAQSLNGRKVVSGCLKPWIDTQGRLVVGDRSVEIALASEGRAAVVVGVGKGWVKLDRAVVVGDGAAQIALGLVGVAAIGEKIRPRRDPNRLVIVDEGAVVVGLR